MGVQVSKIFGGETMEHAFLIEEADWEAEGTYRTENGDILTARGRWTVSHRDDLWIVDGGIEVCTEDGPVEFRSIYQIRPFKEGRQVTTWRADNPALGRLRGVFVVTKDAILSQYHAEEGPAVGAEMLLQVRSWEYRVRGLLRLEQDHTAAWTLRVVSTD